MNLSIGTRVVPEKNRNVRYPDLFLGLPFAKKISAAF